MSKDMIYSIIVLLVVGIGMIKFLRWIFTPSYLRKDGDRYYICYDDPPKKHRLKKIIRWVKKRIAQHNKNKLK